MRLANLKNQLLFPANFIRISEEQWVNDKILFHLGEDIGSMKNKGYKNIVLNVVFVTFWSMGTLTSRQKT